jgi:hypothetical protein
MWNFSQQAYIFLREFCSYDTQNSSVGIVTGRPRSRGLIPVRGKRLFYTVSRPVLGSALSHSQWVPGTLSP